MQKPITLSILACLGLAGCHVFQKSETWKQAVHVRPGDTIRDADPSGAYAAKLHTALGEQGVEHKVVVYQYRYTSRLRDDSVGTRTAVVYRDSATPAYPWWLKDDLQNTPIWLPNGEVDKQISFYLRRPAEIVGKEEYPAQGGKNVVAFAKPSPSLRPTSAIDPRVAPAAEPAKPAASARVAKKNRSIIPTTITKLFKGPASPEEAAPETAPTLDLAADASWSPPAALETNEPSRPQRLRTTNTL